MPLGDLTLDQLSRSWLNYLYLSNFALAFLGSNAIPLDISWSLAVEEQFYLVYPFVVRRLDAPRLERLLIAAVLLSIPLRWLSFRWFPGTHLGPYALPYCRMDGLAAGCIAALLLQRPDLTGARWVASIALPLWLVAVAAVAFGHRHNVVFVTFGYGFIAAATAATIVRLQLGGWQVLRMFLRRRTLVALGKISYGLYLLHMLVRAAFERLPFFQPAARSDLGIALLRTASLIAVSIGVAWCSWLLFESPILRLKGRLDRATTPATHARPERMSG
jgi:peptidoglycan/LPS O-acetylase OafA/YrhL